MHTSASIQSNLQGAPSLQRWGRRIGSPAAKATGHPTTPPEFCNPSAGSRTKLRPHRPSKSLRGLTLIEVIASLVIVGTCVSAMLVAQGDSLRRLADCDRQLMARNLAHELIAGWKLDGEDLRQPEAGQLEEFDGWCWRRSANEYEIIERITGTEITLCIEKCPGRATTSTWSRCYSWLITDAPE